MSSEEMSSSELIGNSAVERIRDRTLATALAKPCLRISELWRNPACGFQRTTNQKAGRIWSLTAA
eukprot:68381-Alexandrium_andersonii.AAC.1